MTHRHRYADGQTEKETQGAHRTMSKQNARQRNRTSVTGDLRSFDENLHRNSTE